MIFSKHEARAIAAGRKTAHLIPARLDPITNRHTPPKHFRKGHDVSVQPGPKADEVCRIIIDHHSLTTLGEIEFADARRLGHRTTADLAREWLRRRSEYPLITSLCEHCAGTGVTDDTGTTECPHCDMGETLIDDPDITDDQALKLYHTHLGTMPVWLVEFHVPADLPRFLARQSDAIYTTRTYDALPNEAEAIDETTLRRYARENRAKDEARRLAASQELAQVEHRPGFPDTHLRKIRALIREGTHIADRRDKAA